SPRTTSCSSPPDAACPPLLTAPLLSATSACNSSSAHTRPPNRTARHEAGCFREMAGTTRLELATSAVTGQRSNQLNYVPKLVVIVSNIFRASRVLAATGSQLMRRLVRLRRPTALLPPTLPFLSVFAHN